MRIVLDTNVLVAAMLAPMSPCARILHMTLNEQLTLCLDFRIYAEYHEVLHRSKFSFDPMHLDAVLGAIHHLGEFIECVPSGRRLIDGDDLPFLEVALSANVDYLVTGNMRHFPAKSCEPARIISPAELLLKIPC